MTQNCNVLVFLFHCSEIDNSKLINTFATERNSLGGNDSKLQRLSFVCLFVCLFHCSEIDNSKLINTFVETTSLNKSVDKNSDSDREKISRWKSIKTTTS
ncbi:MAG: hypothetical protein F6K48_08575 [Okeania sp. SIO3H1]|nr:hypothetical protein [Okeania sp. SIO3H1]